MSICKLMVILHRLTLEKRPTPRLYRSGTVRKENIKAGNITFLLWGLISAFPSVGAIAATTEKETYQPPVEDKFEVIHIIGTNIRGRTDPSSPILMFDREEIEATGFSTTAQFIQHLPQNFSGGASEINGNLGGDGTISVGGTGINLRGLGSDSSLVLLNSHRLASTSVGTFTDISTLPLSAMERIEVMTDGASAIYGSDAVGGVVNFVLRDDFEGAETRLRYGATSEDSVDEMLLAQIFGSSWDDGNGLVSYEFYQRDRLFARERNITKELNHPFTLLPDKESHTVLVSGTQDVADRIRLSGDALFNRRDVKKFQATSLTGFGRPDKTHDKVEQFSLGLKGVIDLDNSWSLDINSAYGRSETRSKSRYLDTRTGNDRHYISTNSSIDIKADGVLLRLSGGDSHLAIGGHFRQETYRDPKTLEKNGVETDASRDIYGTLAEWFIPLVSPANRFAGIERLELTLAARFEDYSDFGSTTDPKIDLLWSPVSELDLRATWGTSFRAPLFFELIEKSNFSWLMNLEDPASPTGKTLALLSYGQNADLGPETATTWTFGFTFVPFSLPNFSFGMTYFDIDFKDRIEYEYVLFDVFTNPAFASFINRNPTPEEIERLLGLQFTNYTSTEIPGKVCCGPPADLSDPLVTVDNRWRNSAITRTTGVDLLLSYELPVYGGMGRFSLNGAYMLKNLRQRGTGDVAVDIADTRYNPADLRLRAEFSWRRDHLAAYLFVNYTGSYKDDGLVPTKRVDSWAPLDLNLSYDMKQDNLRFAFTANNFLNEAPPFVSDTNAFTPDLHFDANNANPLGRFIALSVTKAW